MKEVCVTHDFNYDMHKVFAGISHHVEFLSTTNIQCRMRRVGETDSNGLGALRERISDWYAQRFGVKVASSRIVVTAGASAALQLACLALIESGDEILMPDPSYPCNRHFVSAADGNAVLIPATALERFQLSADKVC